jgi:hypothetical protein
MEYPAPATELPAGDSHGTVTGQSPLEPPAWPEDGGRGRSVLPLAGLTEVRPT